MITTERIETPDSRPIPVIGDWICVQWAPDVGAGEWLNIGVALCNQYGSMHLKMLDQFDRLTCLYGDTILFHVQLACDVAYEMVMKHQSADIDLGPQLRLVKKGSAQGQSESEILGNLYRDVVPLGRPRKAQRAQREFAHKSREDAHVELQTLLKNRLHLDYSRYVRDNPYLESKSGPSLFMPFQRENGVATLASAAYADSLRVRCNLYEAHGEMEVALNERPDVHQGALFVVLPGGGLKAEQRKAVYAAVERVEWIAASASPSIPVHKAKNLNTMSDEIVEWCMAG